MAGRAIAFLAVTSVLMVGCSAHMQYKPKGPVAAEPKPDNCDFEVLTAPPQRPFEELGLISFAGGTQYDSGFIEGVPDRPADFKKKSALMVCRSGGDAVIAQVDNLGQYIRGTVIRYKAQ